MAFIVEDRVRDTSTSTGAGPTGWTVTGTPPTTYRAFDDVMTTNDTFAYCIVHQSADEWEVGIGTMTSAFVFTRTLVLSSSLGEGTTNVTFSAGTKDTILVYPPLNAELFALTDASTVAVDMSKSYNFSLLTTSGIGTNRTLGNPSNTIVGRSGAIVVTTDAVNRTLSYDTSWEAAGGVFPVISVTSGAKDVIFYWVQSSTSIVITGHLKAVA